MGNLESKIKLILDIKEFAVKEMGIAPNNSFRKVNNIDAVYGLYASRKDQIKSIIRDKWEYKSYENKNDCEKEEKLLKAKGYDVLKVKFEAWADKNFQITNSLIASSKTRIAYVVLHENFHIHCEEKNIVLKPSIEESLGDCFAYQSSLEYFAFNPSMIGHIKKDFQEWQKFFDFVNKYAIILKEAYKKSEAEGRKALIRAGMEGKKIQNIAPPINNAFFVSQELYASMAKPVYEAFKDIEPREYIANRKKIYDTLRKIKYKKSS